MKNRTGEEGGQNRKQGNLLCTVICIAEIVQKVTVYKLETENRDRIGEKIGFLARPMSVKPCGTCRVGDAVLWPRLNACETCCKAMDQKKGRGKYGRMNLTTRTGTGAGGTRSSTTKQPNVSFPKVVDETRGRKVMKKTWDRFVFLV